MQELRYLQFPIGALDFLGRSRLGDAEYFVIVYILGCFNGSDGCQEERANEKKRCKRPPSSSIVHSMIACVRNMLLCVCMSGLLSMESIYHGRERTMREKQDARLRLGENKVPRGTAELITSRGSNPEKIHE